MENHRNYLIQKNCFDFDSSYLSIKPLFSGVLTYFHFYCAFLWVRYHWPGLLTHHGKLDYQWAKTNSCILNLFEQTFCYSCWLCWICHYLCYCYVVLTFSSLQLVAASNTVYAAGSHKLGLTSYGWICKNKEQTPTEARMFLQTKINNWTWKLLSFTNSFLNNFLFDKDWYRMFSTMVCRFPTH